MDPKKLVVDQMVEEVLDDPTEDVKVVALSNGAVLRLTAPPTMALQLFRQKHPAPKPPMVHIEEGGRSWDESNPNDPTYLEAVDAHNLESGEALLRLTLWTSCTIEKLPKGVKPYEEDTEWVEEVEELLEAQVSESPRLRKVEWIRYRILGAPRDFTRVQDALTELSGTPEEAVEAAADTFRS